MRDAVAGLDAGGDDRLLLAAREIWIGCLVERRAVELVDDRRAVALEDRLRPARAATSGTRSVAMRATALMPGRIFGSTSIEHETELEVLAAAASRSVKSTLASTEMPLDASP